MTYTPGELRAVGYSAGKAVTEKEVGAVGAPAQIRLRADRTVVQADGFDLCYVTVEVLDADGHLHPCAADKITFSIHGPGKILAVGSSNPISEELYIGNQRKVHRGRTLVVVKSTDDPGGIRLTAQANGLESTDVHIQSELT